MIAHMFANSDIIGMKTPSDQKSGGRSFLLPMTRHLPNISQRFKYSSSTSIKAERLDRQLLLEEENAKKKDKLQGWGFWFGLVGFISGGQLQACFLGRFQELVWRAY